MLVLGRKESEEIIIERGPMKIRVMLVRAGAHEVRIGVDAPSDWNIRRAEIDRIEPDDVDAMPNDLGPWGNV